MAAEVLVKNKIHFPFSDQTDFVIIELDVYWRMENISDPARRTERPGAVASSQPNRYT